MTLQKFINSSELSFPTAPLITSFKNSICKFEFNISFTKDQDLGVANDFSFAFASKVKRFWGLYDKNEILDFLFRI